MAQQQADRPLRNVFVGNIPYDATEEKLREIFTTVGPVVSFRLVYDRETGKPKGYGFCEYKDQETAASAIRNLNGYDINGRQLRVDSASDVRGREEELKNTIPNVSQPTGSGGSITMNTNPGPAPFHETPHSNEVEPDKAPEAISKVVASLPPEQMFELAKQMKESIQNNPNEARAMLVQNPQLVYALLQALVVMRSIDPQTAMNILHKQMAQQIPVATFIQAGTIMQPANVITSIPMQQPIAPQTMPMQVPMPAQHIAPNFMYNTMPTTVQPVHTNPQQPTTTDPRLARGRAAPSTSQQISDQQKAELLMQVLQMTNEQISLLPYDQQQKVLILREQIRAQGGMG